MAKTPKVLDTDALIDGAQKRGFDMLLKGDTFKDLSTVIVTAVRGDRVEKRETECPNCGEAVEHEVSISNGFAPIVVESWKRMIRPMNHAAYDVVIQGDEVGQAYEHAVDAILSHPDLKRCQFVLFLEDDVVLPNMPGTMGPYYALVQRLAEGYDVANGLYWTKSDVAQPLIFGDPKRGTDNFEVITEGWQPGDVVECNGAGMGFSLWKMDIFRDTRIKRPLFHTLQEVGKGVMTQDLYAYKKLRKLGYRVCVDTGVRCGHFNTSDGNVY